MLRSVLVVVASMRYVARLRYARQWNSPSSSWPAKKVVEWCGVEWRRLVSGPVPDQASALIRFRGQAPGVRVR